MIKPRVYLDTTVPSALLDARSPERQQQTAEFWRVVPEQYQLCISKFVLDEIARTPDASKMEALMKLVGSLKVLEPTLEALELAREYVARGAIPEKYIDDARHLAVASAHSVTIVASWNFRHMVKLKTRMQVNAINASLGFPNLEIVAPYQL